MRLAEEEAARAKESSDYHLTTTNKHAQAAEDEWIVGRDQPSHACCQGAEESRSEDDPQ